MATGKMLETAKPPVKRPRKKRNKRKSCTEGNMDQEIWHEFPTELFEAVVSRLPSATIFKFRTVCREWNAFIDSDIFSRCFTELPQTIPWFYTITHVNPIMVQMFDPSLMKWHHPIIPSISKKGNVFPIASVGGLMCFLDSAIGQINIYISNPLTRSFRKLPARSFKVRARAAVGMTLNRNSTSHGYKLLWIGEKGEYEVYDSLENAWTKGGTIRSHLNIPVYLQFKAKPVAIHNTLYLMLMDTKAILSYDTVSGEWNQWIIPNPSHLTNDYTLAGCRNRLLLVGLVTKDAARCVCIWELEKMTMLWKEVDRMPNKWCLKYYGKNLKMKYQDSKGCLILLSLWSRWMKHLIAYNSVTREWFKVPSCTLPHRKRKRLWIRNAMAFYPDPTARP